MAFCITLKNPRIPCRQWINNLWLQIYGRKQYRFIYRLKIPDIGPWYWFSCTPLFTPVAQWCAFWPVDSPQRLLFPEILVLLMVDLRKMACHHTVTKGTGTRDRFSYRWWAGARSAHQGSCPPSHCILCRPFLLPATGLISPGFHSPSVFPWVPVSYFLGLFCLLL